MVSNCLKVFCFYAFLDEKGLERQKGLGDMKNNIESRATAHQNQLQIHEIPRLVRLSMTGICKLTVIKFSNLGIFSSCSQSRGLYLYD
jgi:hypothetical protein